MPQNLWEMTPNYGEMMPNYGEVSQNLWGNDSKLWGSEAKYNGESRHVIPSYKFETGIYRICQLLTLDKEREAKKRSFLNFS